MIKWKPSWYASQSRVKSNTLRVANGVFARGVSPEQWRTCLVGFQLESRAVYKERGEGPLRRPFRLQCSIHLICREVQ